MDIDVKKDIYKKTFIIDNITTSSNFKPIFNININLKLTKSGIIKIHANYKYTYTDNNKFSHIYYFLVIK